MAERRGACNYLLAVDVEMNTVSGYAMSSWGDGSPVVASPRQILRRQLERLAERGWSALAATELEFIVFRDSYEQAWKKRYQDLEPGNLYNVDYSMPTSPTTSTTPTSSCARSRRR